MADVRQMKVRVDTAIKKADTEAILSATFYDDASEWMYVTIVKGSRKTSVTLRASDFADGGKAVDRLVKAAAGRLSHTPIG